MKREILTISLVALATILIFTFTGNARPIDDMRGHKMGYGDFANPGPKHFGMRILFDKDLNLTQEQKDRIFNLIIQNKQRRDSITTELLKVRYERENELSKTNPDFGKIKNLNSRIASLQKDLFESKENLRTEILAILTPDQRQKLQEMYPRWRSYDRPKRGF